MATDKTPSIEVVSVDDDQSAMDEDLKLQREKLDIKYENKTGLVDDEVTRPAPGDDDRDYDLQEFIYGTALTLAPNWEITEEEAASLSVHYCRLLDKYFENWREDSIEVMAGLATVQVVVPRLGLPRKIKDITPKNSDKDPETDDEKETGKKDTQAKKPTRKTR